MNLCNSIPPLLLIQPLPANAHRVNRGWLNDLDPHCPFGCPGRNDGFLDLTCISPPGCEPAYGRSFSLYTLLSAGLPLKNNNNDNNNHHHLPKKHMDSRYFSIISAIWNKTVVSFFLSVYSCVYNMAINLHLFTLYPGTPLGV